MIENMEDKLLEIFTGKAQCSRHDRYNAGPRKRAALNMWVGFNVFTGEQEGGILEKLLDMFCKKRKSSYFDYVMKVLFPETMALLCSAIMEIPHKDADDLLLHGQEEKSSSSSDTGSVLDCENKDACKKDLETEMIQKDSKRLRRKNKEKKKCQIKDCAREVFDMPRHMRQVHDWTMERSKSVNLLWNSRKTYAWKQAPPKRAKVTSSTKEKKKPVSDYRKRCRCPIPDCFAVVKRVDQHLKNVHKIDRTGEEYTELLKNATVFRDVKDSLRDRTQESKYLRRQAIRENLAAANNIPDFRETVDLEVPVYVANSKTESRVYNLSEREAQDCGTVSTAIVLKNFENFLTSVDGGRLDASTASSAVSNIRNVMKAMTTDDLTDLLDRNIIRNEFLANYCEKQSYAPLTVKKYLSSLMHFYDFLINDEISLKNYTADDIIRMKVRISNWSKSYNPAAKEHEALRCEEEMKVLLTPEQIKTYESSENARNAIKLFGEYGSATCPQLSQTDYCCMREYLLMQICLQNTQRSGVCSNLTLQEFNNDCWEGDMFRIRVKKHKTARLYGTAKFYLQRHIYDYMKIFVDSVRSQVIGQSPYLFVSFNGGQMDSGHISRQINASWQKAGVYGGDKPARNLTCTIFRKSASTAVLEHHPQGSKDVADLLLHSEKTQKKYYDVRRRELSTARGAKCVGNLLRYKAVDPESSPVREKTCVEAIDSPRRKWSADEIKEVEQVFNAEIKKGFVSLNLVVEKESYFNLLCGIPNRKIYDKVRSLCKNITLDPNLTLGEIPKETFAEKIKRYDDTAGCDLHMVDEVPDDKDDNDDDDDFIPPSSNATTNNEKLFSKDNATVLKGCCKNIIAVGPINRVRIKETLEKSEDGRKLLDTFNMDSIFNRVKYERRLLRSRK
ncbi:uncharacterized protein LOC130641583 [Hydractinia symbiolongicarpus]|uniref:uncharacterized protein LOC130641583 n=1 Tax=Hydractinia symbiolongicarpus TaxID=13093 RepID=UPI00254DC8EC|nr:uncharacterized protein LOC130641583 [Hydractinia symbiolongicarpus]